MSGFPSRDDLVERYAAAGHSVDDIGWYEAFASHSNDEVVKNKQRSLAVLAWMIENTASVSYEGIVRDVTSAGFVQRHILQVTHHDGETAELSVAIFVSVRNGQVVRIDEYFDADRARAVLRI